MEEARVYGFHYVDNTFYHQTLIKFQVLLDKMKNTCPVQFI